MQGAGMSKTMYAHAGNKYLQLLEIALYTYVRNLERTCAGLGAF